MKKVNNLFCNAWDLKDWVRPPLLDLSSEESLGLVYHICKPLRIDAGIDVEEAQGPDLFQVLFD